MITKSKATQQTSEFSISSTKDRIYSDTLMKNCGISENFFCEINNYVYMIEKDRFKKVGSANEVVAIPIEKINIIKKNKKFYENEEEEIFEKDLEDNIQKESIKYNNTINNSKNKGHENDYYDPQIHFEYLINNLNDGNSESSQAVKAYKSKHKSKFIKIYEANSINFNKNNEYKLFHKCCYPRCNRTFSSSGWLKAHFKEHLKQIHNSLFSRLFDKLVLCNQVQLMNHLNNNFLGLKKK